MSEASYGRLERWLHQLALGSKTVRRIAFDLEKAFALPAEPAIATADGSCGDNPVYVCGLARSGTTMLLRVLDQAESFRSLSYRDMPFVMAPNLWKSLSRFGERNASLSERAHGDGILVGYDSPEAFEEVFWQSFDNPIPGDACYGMPPPSEETLGYFAEYRRLLTRPKGDRSSVARRYLSKNNNNVLRLKSLCAEASATILLVYRDPVATARSLYRQHQRFVNAQQEDAFTLKYMSWLGHHEFGLAHKPFCFALAEMNPSLRPEQPDYWLDYWNAVYRHMLKHEQRQIRLVHHDTMRTEPEAFLARLFELLALEADVPALSRQINAPNEAHAHPDEFSPALVHAAYQTYALLLAKANNLFISRLELRAS